MDSRQILRVEMIVPESSTLGQLPFVGDTILFVSSYPTMGKLPLLSYTTGHHCLSMCLIQPACTKSSSRTEGMDAAWDVFLRLF